MKNSFLFLAFLSVVFFPLISAVEINIPSDFSQGETLIAKISGNLFDSPSTENVVFYRDHVRTSIIPTIVKINNEFYVYAQLADKAPNNYSLALEDVRYYSGSKIETGTFTKNFTITNETADFSVDKGAIATNQSFFIEVKNLRDYEIKISIDEENDTKAEGGFFESLFGGSSSTSSSSITLSPGEKEKINFDEGDQNYNTITLSTENTKYEIPVYIYLSETEQGKKSFRFDPPYVNVSLATNSDANAITYLVNSNDSDIENISLTVSNSIASYVSISAKSIDSLGKNLSRQIRLNISSDSEERIIEGQIIAIEGNGTAAVLNVYLNFIKDYIPANGSTNSETCSQLKGIICSSGEECTGDYKYASDGVCCLAKCQTIKTSSTGKFIGWIIVIAMIAFAIWFYLSKYKQVERISDLMKVLRR